LYDHLHAFPSAGWPFDPGNGGTSLPAITVTVQVALSILLDKSRQIA
jgi:hypothetical protein